MLEKDDAEHPLPEPLRAKFRQVVDAFVAGDYQLSEHPIEGVVPVDEATASRFAENVAAYGGSLTWLDEATWSRSVYRWMGHYWHFIVDLTTEEEAVSDLALCARLHEDGGQLELQSVHVP